MDPERDDERPAWRALRAHHAQIREAHMRDLFADDARRFERFSLSACGLLVDYSKHRITAATMPLLLDLARESDVPGWTRRLFAGEHVNVTEDRAALHMALRHRGGAFPPGDRDVMPAVDAVRRRVAGFVARVRDGAWRGFDGHAIEDVVNLGIGGSDLGPATVAAALAPLDGDGPRTHFVSNIDSAQLAEVLARCEPRTTLFVVASKSFGTQETLANARSARRWLVDAAGGDEAAVARHFVAVSTRLDRTGAFGIDPENVFEFWDWVGGRYSLWSAIGLGAALAIGADAFDELLAGAAGMDEHFRDAPLAENAPVVLALLGIWYRNFFGAPTHVVLPYDHALRLLPAHLQQLEMESNGKGVTRAGGPLPAATCPVVWGGPGNNGQHAFFQLLHQGPALVPADFIVPLRSRHALPGHEEAVLANAFAQTQALMQGRTAGEARAELRGEGLDGEALDAAAAHRASPGNRPSTTIVYERLTPRVLGALVALYEHKVFVQGVCWQVNSFDQWGVELGKQLAARLQPSLEGGPIPDPVDASTAGLLRHARRVRGG